MNPQGFMAKQRALAAGYPSMQEWVCDLVRAGQGADEIALFVGITVTAVRQNARKGNTFTPSAQQRKDNAAAAQAAGYPNTNAWVWGLSRLGQTPGEIVKITGLTRKTVVQHLAKPERNHDPLPLPVVEEQPDVKLVDETEEEGEWKRPVIESPLRPLHLLPPGNRRALITPGEYTCGRCGDTVGQSWVYRGGKCLTCNSDKYFILTESYLRPEETQWASGAYAGEYQAIQAERSDHVSARHIEDTSHLSWAAQPGSYSD